MATPIPLSDVVDVTISVEQSLQTSNGFAVPMIIDSEYVYGATSRVLTVGNLAEMAAAGYGTYHRAYRMARAIFGQTRAPKQLKIGQWNLPASETITAAWSAIVAADPDFYWTTITDRSKSTINTLAPLVSAMAAPYMFLAETADADVLTGASGNVAENERLAGNDFCRIYYKASTPQVTQLKLRALTTGGTFTAKIDGQTITDAWAVDNDTSIASLAAKIQALGTITTAAVTSSGDLGVADDVITIASADSLNLTTIDITANYAGGPFVQSITTQASAPLAASMAGYLAPHLPGQVIEAFAPVKGVSPDSLTTSQRAALLENNVGWFGQYGNKPSMGGGANYGRVASGAYYLDVRVLVDWLTIAIQAAVMGELQSGVPVRYTAQGIERIVQAVRSPLAEGVQRGVVLPSGNIADGDLGTVGYYVSAPDLSAISDSDKTARHLPNVQFQARPSGAIQQVTIRGNLAL